MCIYADNIRICDRLKFLKFVETLSTYSETILLTSRSELEFPPCYYNMYVCSVEEAQQLQNTRRR